MALGFRHRDDVTEVTRLLAELGVEVAVIAPWNATPDDLARLPQADFNVVMYPELAQQAAAWLQRIHGQPFTRTVPIRLGATREFIAEVAQLAGADATALLARADARASWY